MPETFEFVLIADDMKDVVRFYFHTHLEAVEAAEILWQPGMDMTIPNGFGYSTWYYIKGRWLY